MTATVLAHERGPKILIGKYRRRTGYKRHNGFRAATSRVEITIGAGGAKKAAAAKPGARLQAAEPVEGRRRSRLRETEADGDRGVRDRDARGRAPRASRPGTRR